LPLSDHFETENSNSNPATDSEKSGADDNSETMVQVALGGTIIEQMPNHAELPSPGMMAPALWRPSANENQPGKLKILKYELLFVTTAFDFTPLKARNLAAAGLVSDRQNRDEKCSGCPRRFLSCIC